MMQYDVILIGQIEGSQTGGFTGDGSSPYTYLETLAPTYLCNHFYNTFCAEPVFLLQLAAELRAKGLKVKVLDGLTGNLTKETLYLELKKYETSIYAFSLFHSSYSAVVELARKIKNVHPNSTIITGGTYATLVYKPLLEKHPEFDYVVLGDGDRSLPKLCTVLISKKMSKIEPIHGIAYRYGNTIKETPPEPVNLDSVQPLARDFSNAILEKKFSFSMVASRGCGHGVCSFCYLPRYQKLSNHPKYRHRCIESIIREMTDLKSTYNVSHITFVDEDFFCGTPQESIERATDFANALITSKLNMTFYVNARINTINNLIRSKIGNTDDNVIALLVRAGLRFVFVGIESGSDDILRNYKKGTTVASIKMTADELAKHNIKINPGLITFTPSLTVHHVKDNIDMMRYINYYDIFMFTRKLVILPGTQIGTISGLWELPSDNSNVVYDFDYTETKNLYFALIAFRDKLFPIYKKLTVTGFVNEKTRDRLAYNHFRCFYELYHDIVENDARGISMIINKHLVLAEKIADE